MSLRVFLLRTSQGWEVMPGGFARIGRSGDAGAIAMQKGGAAADVWIVSPRPVETATLLPAGGEVARRGLSVLPARAADNLFWLGRYVERTEGILRLLRARNARLAEGGSAASPLLSAMDPLLTVLGVDPNEGIPQGLIQTLGAAIASAGAVRDRLSPDGWSALADLDKTMRRMAQRVTVGDDAARAIGKLLRKLTGFSGLVHENMYRFLGWRFLKLGQHHERAMGMTAILAMLADPDAPEGALDLAIEVGDSVMTHRRRFALVTARETVVELLALDEMNPRAVRFQLDGIRDQLAHLPGASGRGSTVALSRAVAALHGRLDRTSPEALDTTALWAFRSELAAVSELVTEGYLR